MWISKRNLAFSEHADEKDEQLIELVYYIPDDIDQPDFISPPGKGSVTKIDDSNIEIYFEDAHGNSLTIRYEWVDMSWTIKESDFTEWDDDFDPKDTQHDNYDIDGDDIEDVVEEDEDYEE